MRAVLLLGCLLCRTQLLTDWQTPFLLSTPMLALPQCPKLLDAWRRSGRAAWQEACNSLLREAGLA